MAGVGTDDDLGGHRSLGEGELGARVCGEVRGVHGWTQRNMVSALDTVRWPEDGREHVGDEIRGGACGRSSCGGYTARGRERKGRRGSYAHRALVEATGGVGDELRRRRR